jgi:hypothetical protein
MLEGMAGYFMTSLVDAPDQLRIVVGAGARQGCRANHSKTGWDAVFGVQLQ